MKTDLRNKIKICGITREEDAYMCAELGFGAIGFVFYRPSPRYISPEKTLHILRGVRKDFPAIRAVGVFVDEEPKSLLSIAETAQLDVVQLHGNEKMENYDIIISKFSKIVKVARSLEDGRQIAKKFPEHVAILLECSTGDLPGGNGARWNWAKTADLRKVCKHCIGIAGGLQPSNFLYAAAVSQADFFDLSSGVECAPGIKNYDELRKLAEIAGEKTL